LERGAVQCGNDPITGVDPDLPFEHFQTGRSPIEPTSCKRPLNPLRTMREFKRQVRKRPTG
ncbi:hypothetical protein, partial [Accumulibacter sp.]|uniref:hypothetical protein n=1 Tax=Accumulibacter sp. TaxID=2053492 RepID=UPI0025912579